jgi:hypothetical protein
MNKPLCKVAIGSAYQRPLRRDFTYEELFWQDVLLRREESSSEIMKAWTGALMLAATLGGLLWML